MLVGVVGKPSVGKSTFFKAITLAEVAIAPYPFTTIDPNKGTGFVKVHCVDEEFNVTCNPREGFCINHNRFVPVELLDVAGLVPGAHEGLGLGNQFLDDLRQADVLIHVIDISGSTNAKGEIVDAGSYDPKNDILFLEEELDYWYLGILKKGWDKFARTIQSEKKEVTKALGKQLSGLKVTDEMVEDTIKKLNLDVENVLKWTETDLFNISRDLRIKTKPMIIACNKMDVRTGKDNYIRLKEEFKNHILIPCSAESELALREAAKKELIKYIPGENSFEIKNKDKLSVQQVNALNYLKLNILEKLGSTGVQEVLDKAVFELLGFIAVFPGGVNKLTDSKGRTLPDCFLIPGKSTALDFAFRIHTDIGNHFIRAIDVKTKRTVGKEHILNHRDVLEIVCSK